MTEDDPIALEAALEITGEQLRGEVSGPNGRSTSFCGWLGLIAAVESAADAARAGAPSTSEHEPLPEKET